MPSLQSDLLFGLSGALMMASLAFLAMHAKRKPVAPLLGLVVQFLLLGCVLAAALPLALPGWASVAIAFTTGMNTFGYLSRRQAKKTETGHVS